ncbi:prp19p [Saccharomyces arboricola H-6]|uniref:Pre-mRNA-processing factor 19 n=1 Tax=Saccharomyces arboricola (strain H-6 / AS 2.3317 / CBS 10644) TaxID=1160507 RepID=J8LL60_SACAR|nr:prp19p [Saccharomyces arboricola H-6]
MFCAISGKVPRKPVLSPRSKSVFEKSLLEQYVKDTGNDPITNEPLSLEEIIEIVPSAQQAALTESTNSATLKGNYSIPNLLTSLQNEWDAIMLENFKLRSTLDSLTKKLSTVMYERDAAKLVAAQVMMENDAKSSGLSESPQQVAIATREEFLQGLLQSSRDLVARGRPKAVKWPILKGAELLPAQDYSYTVKTYPYKELNSLMYYNKWVFMCHYRTNTFHFTELKDSKSITTITTPNPQTGGEQPVIASKGSNNRLLLLYPGNRIIIMDLETNTLLREIDISSPNQLIYVYGHNEVNTDYFIWADSKGTIGFQSYTNESQYIVHTGRSDVEYSNGALHKDSLLLALYSLDRTLDVYNLSSFDQASSRFPVGEDTKIKEVKFADNGYWMVVKCNQMVTCFDLRKDVGTLAYPTYTLPGIEVGTVVYDIDDSGKNMIVYSNESKSLTVHKFDKKTKSWRGDESNTLDLPSETADFTDIEVVCGDGGIAAVLKTKDSFNIVALTP